ncbi:UNKNOWN [Stylonychia lemnae]|uniref:Uncharacterized protein n=1 Tax=Stylonychia lemnae TaxID=5949 RepID=A0A078AZJ2_STYLE|nr:UNKNOWN [Stylonychia lemnae]|eukprot:CDW87579.1 UNKNOWN [Stylonychia lemnae]
MTKIIHQILRSSISLTSVYQKGPSRRDDLLSIMYLLIYLKEGTLPWTKNFNIETIEGNFKKVLELKRKLHQKASAQQNQCVFRGLIRYIDTLEYDETPDYSYCVNQLVRLIKSQGQVLDWVMDWSTPGSSTYSTYLDSDMSRIQVMSQLDVTNVFEKSQNSQISLLSPLMPLGRFRSLKKNRNDSADDFEDNNDKISQAPSQIVIGVNQEQNQSKKCLRKGSLGQYIEQEKSQQPLKLWTPLKIGRIQEDLHEEEDSESYSCRHLKQEALKIPFPNNNSKQKEVILNPIDIKERSSFMNQERCLEFITLMQQNNQIKQRVEKMRTCQEQIKIQNIFQKRNTSPEQIKDKLVNVNGGMLRVPQPQQNFGQQYLIDNNSRKLHSPSRASPQQPFKLKLISNFDEWEIFDQDIDEQLSFRYNRHLSDHLGEQQTQFHENNLKVVHRRAFSAIGCKH